MDRTAVMPLAAMHARYRDLIGRVLTPTATALATPGHQLLLTDHGPLDLLGAVGGGLGSLDRLEGGVLALVVERF